MKIIFLRHGMTKGNLEKKYIGITDECLIEEGKKQLLEEKNMECFQKVLLVFSSPMKRCLETAHLLFPDRHIYVIEKFKECDFGLFEGKNFQQLKEDVNYQKWMKSGGMEDFPGGESVRAFKERCVKGFFQMLDESRQLLVKEKNCTIACVVHGGTIMSIMEALAFPEKGYFDYQVKNGEGYLCQWKEGSLWIEQHVS